MTPMGPGGWHRERVGPCPAPQDARRRDGARTAPCTPPHPAPHPHPAPCPHRAPSPHPAPHPHREHHPARGLRIPRRAPGAPHRQPRHRQPRHRARPRSLPALGARPQAEPPPLRRFLCSRSRHFPGNPALALPPRPAEEQSRPHSPPFLRVCHGAPVLWFYSAGRGREGPGPGFPSAPAPPVSPRLPRHFLSHPDSRCRECARCQGRPGHAKTMGTGTPS